VGESHYLILSLGGNEATCWGHFEWLSLGCEGKPCVQFFEGNVTSKDDETIHFDVDSHGSKFDLTVSWIEADEHGGHQGLHCSGTGGLTLNPKP